MDKFKIKDLKLPSLTLPSYESAYKINPIMKDIYVKCELSKPVPPITPPPGPIFLCPHASPDELFDFSSSEVNGELCKSALLKDFITHQEHIVFPSYNDDEVIEVVYGPRQPNVVGTIRKLEFCDGPKYIGNPYAVDGNRDYQFANLNIEELILPNTLKAVSISAFRCNKLTSIDIPRGNIDLYPLSFSYNNIEELHYKLGWNIYENSSPQGFPGEGPFENSNIKRLIIEEGVTRVSGLSYNELTSLTTPSTLKNIGRVNRNKLTNVNLNSGLEVIEERAFMYNQLTNVVIPNTVKVIERHAFANNKLNSVIIPSPVKVLGAYSFWSNNISNVNINNGVEIIEEKAFSHNSIVNLNIPGNVRIIGDAAFSFNKIKTLKLNNGLKEIGSSAFSLGDRIDNVYVPDSVTDIGSGAFNVRESLRIGDNAVNVGNLSVNKLYANLLPGDYIEDNGPGKYKDVYFRGGKIQAREIYPLSSYPY